MEFNPVLLNERSANIRAKGQWHDHTILDHFEKILTATPDKEALVAYRQDKADPQRFTYAELNGIVDTIAVNLMKLGVKRGEVVSFQLPNWWEFIALSLACVRIGAVANCLMPILGENELQFMLQRAESKVLIVPKVFRGRDFESMGRSLKASLPTLENVIVVDGKGSDSFNNMLLKPAPTEELEGRQPLAPDDILLVMFTSGTTGEPKGVMHSSNTMLKGVQALIDRMKISGDDNVLAATPLGHLTGYAVLAMLPLMLGNTVALQDVWDAKKGLEIIEKEEIGFTAASTPFLVDLCNAVEEGIPCPESFRLFLCAGAPIPSALVNRASEKMGLTVCSAWGMTEVVAACITDPDRAEEKSPVSDGRALEDVEVMIADHEGNPLPEGETGRLLIKTPSLFGGYLKRPDLSKLDDNGWFDSGDMAYADSEGFIRINGRSKDIIIRGGENIPVMEVENILFKHSAVSMAAVVAFPDSRMGERAAAYVVEKPGEKFTFEDMSRHFADNKVTKQFWPERLEIVESLPATPSGKIQKFKLREDAKKFGDAES